MSVLPFQTRDAYETKLFAEISTEAQTPQELEALEQFKALYDHSVKALTLLQTFYKKTGKWHPVNDEQMARMVTCATIISANIAGVRHHGTQAGQQEQTEGTSPNHDGAVA